MVGPASGITIGSGGNTRNGQNTWLIARGSFTAPNSYNPGARPTFIVGGLRRVHHVSIMGSNNGFFPELATSTTLPTTAPTVTYALRVFGGTSGAANQTSGAALVEIVSGTTAQSGATFFYEAIGE